MKIYELRKFKDTDDGTMEWSVHFNSFDEAREQVKIKEKTSSLPEFVPCAPGVSGFWQWHDYEIMEIVVEGTREVYVVSQGLDGHMGGSVVDVITSSIGAAMDHLVDRGFEKSGIIQTAPMTWWVEADDNAPIHKATYFCYSIKKVGVLDA